MIDALTRRWRWPVYALLVYIPVSGIASRFRASHPEPPVATSIAAAHHHVVRIGKV